MATEVGINYTVVEEAIEKLKVLVGRVSDVMEAAAKLKEAHPEWQKGKQAEMAQQIAVDGAEKMALIQSNIDALQKYSNNASVVFKNTEARGANSMYNAYVNMTV